MKLPPPAISKLSSLYASCPRSSGSKRTRAIFDAFKRALLDPVLSSFRPDEIWTALNDVYVETEAAASFAKYNSKVIGASELAEAIKSVLNGWVKSSGTAFEYFLTDHYDNIFKSLTTPTPVRLLLKADSELARLRPTNLPCGDNTVDDLYLLTKSGPAWVVFGMVSAQASGGDRWLRGEQRCNFLRVGGINCINITLDPRDISRSPQGNLTQPSYLTRFQSANPSYNAHFVIDVADRAITIPPAVTVSRASHTLQQPSRLFKTDVRKNGDLLTQKTLAAAAAFVSCGNALPSNHHW